jgi:thiol:disulfide interchange protein DsbD
VIAGALLAISPPSFAQGNVLSVVPPDRLPAKPGATIQSKLAVQLRPGYHVNSNTPSDEYLIPLRLTWTGGPLETLEVVFPKPQMEKYSFSEKPLSVFSGDFELVTKFKVAATAAPGPVTLTGKLRYQACNDRMCLPPKNVDITLPVDIVK